MAKKSKQARAREFSPKSRKEIYQRDKDSCIFCIMGYRMEKAGWWERENLSIMHYIPRSKNGLGIPENGALGCLYHHHKLDNGKEGEREDMLKLFREYLQSHYKDWSEDKLVYSKWTF